MPAADAAVWVDVLPSMRKFGPAMRRELGAASSQAETAGAAAGKGYGSGFHRAAGIGVKAFAAAGTGLLAIAGYGLKVASANEQAQISFETMLGSAGKAQKFLGQLQAFAAKTPFEFPELQTAASHLIAVGVNADKVIPIMTSLGNVTAGMGTGAQGVERATFALEQMSTAGKVTGQDLMQLEQAGVPALNILAAATGKSKEQIAAMAKSGKLGKKELDALFRGLETGAGLEKFNGLMDKQSQSLSGLLSTFKDTFGQGLAKAVAPALPMLKNALNGVNGVMANIFAGINTFGRGIKGGTTALGGFGAVMNTFGRGVRAMALSFQLGNGTAKGFIGVMQHIGLTARAAFGWFRTVAIPALKDLGQQFVTGAVPALRAFANYVTHTLMPAVGRLVGSFSTNVLPALRDVAGFLLSKVVPAVARFVFWLNGKLIPIAAAVGDAIFRLVGFLHQHQAVVVPVIAGVAAFVAVLKVAKAVTSGFALVTKGITAVTRGWAIAQGLLNAVMALNPFVLIAALVIGLGVALVVAYKKSETFRKAVGAAWSFIKNAFITGIQFVTGIYLGFVGMLLNGAAKAFGWIPGIGPKLKTAADSFEKFKSRVNAQLEGLKDKDVSVGISLNSSAVQALRAAGYQVGRSSAAGPVVVRDPGTGRRTTLARGGPVGHGVGTRDDVPALLTRGEHVWTTREVGAVGGHTAMHSLRSAALAGALPAFAAGGGVDVNSPTPSKAATQALVDRMRAARDLAAAGVAHQVSTGLGRAVSRRLATQATDAGNPSYLGGPLGAVVFPLPAGSYSIGVPLNGYSGHTGQDFPAAIGTPVYAPFAGNFVPRTLRNPDGSYRSYGNMGNVYGAAGLRFIAGHMSQFARGAGLVRAGEMIGRVGSTGNSSGPHLHAEFRRNGTVINPHEVLKFDQGGKLPPGYSTVLNATGRPEAVFNRQQFAALSKGSGSQPPNVQVIIDGREIESAVVRVTDRRDHALSDGFTYRSA